MSIEISVDAEFTGPIPGRHSMVSIGAVALDWTPDGCRVVGEFTCNIAELPGSVRNPDTMHGFWAQFPEAWAATQTDQQDPTAAMHAYADWVEQFTEPTFWAYPLAPDWLFSQWYLGTFTGREPFGYRGDCMNMLAATLLGIRTRDLTDEMVEQHFPSTQPHTHIALDDAREQAERLVHMLNRLHAQRLAPS